MGHDHDGHSHHDFSRNGLNWAFFWAIFLNGAFIALELVYAYFADSMSLFADALHNFGDVFGLILAWLANILLGLPARQRYSYGYKRTTILAAFANAVILVATSLYIFYQAVHKLLVTHYVNETIIFWVGLLGIAVNFGTSLLFYRGRHHDLNVRGAFLHLLADALIALGVVIGAALIHVTGFEWIDPLLSILIVLIILFATWQLLRDSLRLMMDAVPHHIDHHGIQQYLREIPGVVQVHDLHIWGLSTREVALTVHLVMPERMLSNEDYSAINDVLHHTYRVDHATIQVERTLDERCPNHVSDTVSEACYRGS